MTPEPRSEEEIRREIAAERAELAQAVTTLRADVRAKRRPLGRAAVVLSAALGALLVRRVARRLGCCDGQRRRT